MTPQDHHYAILMDIKERLGGMDAKIDSLAAGDDKADRRFAAHSRRLDSLEHSRTKWQAIVAVIAAVFGAASAKLTAMLGFS